MRYLWYIADKVWATGSGALMCGSVDVSSCSLVGFRKLVFDPLKSTISGYFNWMVEEIRKCGNDS